MQLGLESRIEQDGSAFLEIFCVHSKLILILCPEPFEIGPEADEMIRHHWKQFQEPSGQPQCLLDPRPQDLSVFSGRMQMVDNIGIHFRKIDGVDIWFFNVV